METPHEMQRSLRSRARGVGTLPGGRGDDWLPGPPGPLGAFGGEARSRGGGGRGDDARGPNMEATGETRLYSLNIAIAVPPEVTLTERVLVAPDGGLQLTE